VAPADIGTKQNAKEPISEAVRTIGPSGPLSAAANWHRLPGAGAPGSRTCILGYCTDAPLENNQPAQLWIGLMRTTRYSSGRSLGSYKWSYVGTWSGVRWRPSRSGR